MHRSGKYGLRCQCFWLQLMYALFGEALGWVVIFKRMSVRWLKQKSHPQLLLMDSGDFSTENRCDEFRFLDKLIHLS